MKGYKKLFKFFILLTVLVSLAGCMQQTNGKKSPEAVMGNLDISAWDFEKDGIINLKGNWEFYRQQLVDPESFNGGISLKREFIRVPDAWDNSDYNQERFPGDGYATYRLIINTNLRNKPLALDIPKINTAYKLWINKDLSVVSGKIGIIAEEAIPQSQPGVVFFDSGEGKIELVLQVSNFHQKNGGILENIRLGTEAQIKLIGNRYLAFDLFVFGSLFVVGIYHIVFYLYRRKEKSNLYFGAFCTMIGLRTLFVGRVFIFQLMPDFSWELALKAEYLSFYLGSPLFILYLKSIIPREISSKVIRLSTVVSIVFSALVILNPVKVYAHYNILYQVFAIFLISYILYATILAFLRKREGAVAIGLAIVFFVTTIINDILYESSLIYLGKDIVTTSLSSWGFLVFVLSQSLILSRKFTRAFSRIEEMTANLQQLNESLEDKVQERTTALENSNKKLEQAYEELSKMEKSRTDLLTNISHDLRSPMASVLGYINAILDGVIEEPDKLKRYLQRIRDRINGLNHLTQELFDLTQLETRKVSLELMKVSGVKLLQKVYDKYLLDVQRAGISFKLIQENDKSDLQDIPIVEVDIDRIDRAFANLIYNAIKHTPKGGVITLDYSVDANANPGELIIKVADSGSGISEGDLPHVFNRFFTGSKSRTSGGGSGLGLAITREIVEIHKGRIWATSSQGYGTTFCIALPLRNKK